jgi:hypothetical protein
MRNQEDFRAIDKVFSHDKDFRDLFEDAKKTYEEIKRIMD